MQVHQLLELGHSVGSSDSHSCVEGVVFEFGSELLVVDLAITVSVNALHDLVNLARSDAETEASEGISELYLGDITIAILVELVEDLLHGLG